MTAEPEASRSEAVHQYLRSLQQELCRSFGALERSRQFDFDAWERPASGSLQGNGITAVLESGEVIERGGVAFSDVRGSQLPPAATARNPHLAGRSYRAMGLSVVVHPGNPHVPTSHMNVRAFTAGDVWWFGGGFDLTPYLVNEQDVRDWHRAAAQACAGFYPGLYAHARTTCDEYFFLRHRGEARGVGGIFFDDLNDLTPDFGMSWERCFEFMRTVGATYRDTYLRILSARRDQPFGERERSYQLHRRGRYVEFNLVFDRGTLFGLQSGGRVQSILMSMPPLVSWSYASPDAQLDAQLLPYLTTLRGKDWLAS